ncbi:MAG: phosphoadenosine phosphosulfate reductase family protein [Nitrospinota bacterium]|nr:phosphoadenosine phosphosulfate reductase family protein [Nitrospinota bacterium]
MRKQLSLLGEDKPAEAIEFLRMQEPAEGYAVKFSGGKDSIVLYSLVLLSGVKHRAFYNVTTIDPPELARFIKLNYPEVIWLYPKKNFFQLSMQKGIPTVAKRWCCEKLKHKGNKRAYGTKHIVTGIRSDESRMRAGRARITQMEGQFLYAPIFNFTEEDVWSYIRSKGLAYPKLYDEGFARLGCVICPFICRPGILDKHRKRWPATYRRFEKVFAEYYKLKKSYYDMRGIKNAEELLRLWYGGKPLPAMNRNQIGLWRR